MKNIVIVLLVGLIALTSMEQKVRKLQQGSCAVTTGEFPELGLGLA